VGFSVNEATSFSVYTDNRTAEANFGFLQQWYAAFPEFQTNDFWITGESYAGHYIPTLVYQIVQNEGNASTIPINLQGFAVGNPSTNFTYDDGTLYHDYL
jgi:carboxypeptidase C (cathepsin A)